MTPQERAILTRTASGLSLQLKCGVYYNADRPDEFRVVKDVEGDQEQARCVAEELREKKHKTALRRAVEEIDGDNDAD